MHLHLYQPPREVPSLGTVAREVSAAPFHDWNERITAECYRPLTAARLLDERGLIAAAPNLFEQISFNVGPTLHAWLEEHAPDVDDAIRAADAGDGAPRRTRARDRPAVRARDPPARDAARPRDARPVGGHRLPPSIRPRPRGHVAPGDGRRRRHARVSRRGRDRLHHRRPAPDRADPCAGRRRVAAGRRRGRPVRPLRGPAPVGSVDHRLRVRQPAVAGGRVRPRAPRRRGALRGPAPGRAARRRATDDS